MKVLKSVVVLSLILILLSIMGCTFHAQTTMGAGKSGNQAAANINADEPSGIYGNFPPSNTNYKKVTESSSSRPARD